MPYANGQPTARELAAQRKPADPTSPNYGVGVGGNSTPTVSQNMWGNISTNWVWVGLNAWPLKPNVVNTNNYRDTAQENANFIENRVNWGKTLTNTTTSAGKTTKTYSDGTTETTDSGVSDTTGTPTRTNLLDEQKNIYSEQEKLQTDIVKRYDDLKISGDVAYNQLVDNTKAQFSSLRTQLTDANRRFEMKTSQGQYLNNGFRYTPQSSEGMVYDAEQAWLAKLGDLNLKESTALQMALSAKNDNDYAALAQYTNAVRSIQQDRMSTIQAMTTQIKTIEDTDKNIRNMNPNEAKFMQSMIDSYILTAWDMDATKTEEYYKKQSKELSDIMWFDVAPEFIKAQVEWAKATAKLEVNKGLTEMNWFYTDSLGRPMTNAEGKQIPFAKEDWGTWIEGNILNVGTYDTNGNKVMKTYELKGWEKSYAETIKNLAPTKTNVTITWLAQAYTWPMSELLLTKENTFIPTTNPAYKNIGNWGMQCAEFVNRVAGTSFSSGKAANKEPASSLWVGSIASWSPAGAGKYGHAGIIVGQEWDNWIIKSVNLRWNGIVSIDSIPKSVIEWGYTPDSVKNMPMEVSGVYDPNQDTNITPIGQNKDGTGIYIDNNTNKTISEEEAKALYGSTVWQQTSQYTPDQIAVMNTITGKPTAGDKVTLAKYKLNEADLWKYRQIESTKTKALSDDQRSIYNSEKSRFMSDPVVKTFNESLTQLDNSVASLNSDSWPWDIAGVYQFMKTLDPTSVVRETEFNTAARSAGVLSYVWNTWERLENWEVLTPEQRDAFSKLMKSYVANKWKQYNRLYDDLGRVFELSWIPKEYMPTRAWMDTNTESQPTQTDSSWWTTN